jgi:hypothetical protein
MVVYVLELRDENGFGLFNGLGSGALFGETGGCPSSGWAYFASTDSRKNTNASYMRVRAAFGRGKGDYGD